MSRFCAFRFPPRLHCVHCYLEFSLVAGIGFWSGIWQGKNPSHLNGLKIQVQFHKLVGILDFFQFQIPNPTTMSVGRLIGHFLPANQTLSIG